MQNKDNATIIDGDYLPKEVLGIISRMHVFIASPLHALVYAAISNVPFIGMEYCSNDNSKIASFFESIDEEDYLVSRFDDESLNEFKNKVDKTFLELDLRKQKLQENVKAIKKKAELNFKLLSIKI